MNNSAEAASRALALSKQIKPLLAGQGPDLQAAALADLVSVWLAGHPKALREELFSDWIATVRQLLPVSIAEIFGNEPPPGWEA